MINIDEARKQNLRKGEINMNDKITKIPIPVNEYKRLIEANTILDAVIGLFSRTESWMFEDAMCGLGFMSHKKLKELEEKKPSCKHEGSAQDDPDTILCETTNHRKEVNNCEENQGQPDVNMGQLDVNTISDENANVLGGTE